MFPRTDLLLRVLEEQVLDTFLDENPLPMTMCFYFVLISSSSIDVISNWPLVP